MCFAPVRILDRWVDALATGFASKSANDSAGDEPDSSSYRTSHRADGCAGRCAGGCAHAGSDGVCSGCTGDRIAIGWIAVAIGIRDFDVLICRLIFHGICLILSVQASYGMICVEMG